LLKTSRWNERDCNPEESSGDEPFGSLRKTLRCYNLTQYNDSPEPPKYDLDRA